MVTKLKVIIVLLSVLFLMSCGGLQSNNISWDQLSVKQKATYFMGLYNYHYDDYLFKSALPDLTEGEKEILREKKKVLEYVHPILDSYIVLSLGQGAVSGDVEAEILHVLEKLADMVVRKL